MIENESIYPSLNPGDAVARPTTPFTEKDIIRQWAGDLDAPLVSIVCHTFNHGRFIEDALNGFLIQETKFPFEIVVHDDASTDNTQDIIKRYLKRFPNILRPIFQKENIFSKGQRPTLYSFPAAKGKYIAFCEGDDFWVDNRKLQIQVSFLEDNPDYVVCYTDSVPFQDETVVNMDYGGSREDLSAKELQRAPAIFTLTSCFRNVLDNPPELALVRYGDRFFWSRLGKYGKGKFLGQIQPSFYRVHSTGVHSSGSMLEKSMMGIQTYSAMAAYYKRLGDDELFYYFLGRLRDEVYSYDGLSLRLLRVLLFFSKILRKIKRFITSIW